MQERNRTHDENERNQDSARVSEPVSSAPSEDDREDGRSRPEASEEHGVAKGADEDEQRFDAG